VGGLNLEGPRGKNPILLYGQFAPGDRYKRLSLLKSMVFFHLCSKIHSYGKYKMFI
jgi:hypothetical protein